jgi:hypothetical protein
VQTHRHHYHPRTCAIIAGLDNMDVTMDWMAGFWSISMLDARSMPATPGAPPGMPPMPPSPPNAAKGFTAGAAPGAAAAGAAMPPKGMPPMNAANGLAAAPPENTYTHTRREGVSDDARG